MVQLANFNEPMARTPARGGHPQPTIARAAVEPSRCLANGNQLRLLADDELESLPPLEYLVRGVIPAGGFVVVAGASGAGKTFFILDLALSIATGTPWHGHEVTHGPVVYVAGEGIRGLAGRINAWKDLHGFAGRAGLFILPQATDLTRPEEVGRLLLAMQVLPSAPRAVIVDTLARNIGDADENSACDVGRLTVGVDRIREATGATVILLHHTGLKADRERGSSALRANADTTILLRGSRRGLIRIDCAKQKDAEPFASMVLQLTKRGESCVLLPAPPNSVATATMSATELRVLRVLAAAMPEGLTYTQWAAASGLRGGAFDRPAKALVSRGLVVGGGGGKGVPYVVTPEGMAAAV